VNRSFPWPAGYSVWQRHQEELAAAGQ
jgi:hypothetical protein